MLLIKIRCRWCGTFFCLCRRCYRGHCYCSEGCRIAGNRLARREAQRRYRQTSKGKKAHREAEKRRRMRRNEKKQKIMDDKTTILIPLVCKLISFFFNTEEKRRCHVCRCKGRIVKKFPRRGYGNRKTTSMPGQKSRPMEGGCNGKKKSPET